MSGLPGLDISSQRPLKASLLGPKSAKNEFLVSWWAVHWFYGGPTHFCNVLSGVGKVHGAVSHPTNTS